MIMKKAFLVSFAVALFGGAFFTSCPKAAGPGTAEVKVLDADGIAQAGVKVVLFCTEPSCVVRREGVTNELGIYREDFELPVVLRVRSVRYDTTTTKVGLPPNQITKITVDSVCGEGYIQIDNDQISNETVTILECN